MFIGQAPCREEDNLGETFVGAAGELLMDAIREYGIEEIPHRFENVCRCHPLDDKKPLKKHITACFPYLQEAIRTYQPDILVPLGACAFETVTGIRKITEFLGIMFEVEGEEGKGRWKIFPMYHPSAILHQERLLGEFTTQIMTLARLLKGTRSRIRGNPNYTLVSHPFLADLDLDSLDRDIPVAIDFETYGGFDPKAENTNIRCLGISTSINSGICLDMSDRKMKREAVSLLRNQNKLIAHNAKYEMKWAIQKLGIEPRITDDTSIMAHLIDETTSVKLETVGTLYTDMVNHKGDFSYAMYKNKWTWEDAPIEELAKYNCADCDMTLRLYYILGKQIDSFGMRRLYEEVEMPTMRTLARIELRGMAIDGKMAEKVKNDGKKRMEEIRKKIEAWAEVKYGMKRIGVKELNLNSSHHVFKLFYQWWKFADASIPRTSSGQYSTDKYAIDILAEKYPQVKLVKEYRGISHSISDIEVIQEKAIDGKISSDLNQTYVVTGRLSSRDPNLQNLPNPKEIEDSGESRKFGDAVKRIFISRFGDGGLILNADYSQLELRLVANESGDPTYVDALNNGKDLHTITAKHLPGVNPNAVTKEQRFIAKRLNFAVVYGAGAGELSKNFRKPKAECAKYLESYNRTYPYVAQYMQSLHDEARLKGYVTSKFGRRRHLPGILADEWWECKRAMNQAGNFPIASLGADLTKWAMATVDQELVEEGFKSMVIGQVHDSIIIDLYKSETRQVKRILKRVMVDQAMKTWPFFDKCPLKVDVSVGPNWLEQTDI